MSYTKTVFFFKHTWWTLILSDSCMTGYINNTLATAFMSNEAVRRDFKELITDNGYNVTQCRCDNFLLLHLNIKRMNLTGCFILYGLMRKCFMWYRVIALNVYLCVVQLQRLPQWWRPESHLSVLAHSGTPLCLCYSVWGTNVRAISVLYSILSY